MEGVELAARFGSITNNLKYCGPSDFQKLFKNYLQEKNGANEKLLQKALKKFEAHYAYLKLIAEANGMKPFDYEVAEALWLGNGLVEKVERAQIEKTIMRDLTGTGKMHIERARDAAAKIPEGMLPHHSFHVYYVKFITGKVLWNLENADMCRVPYGRVLEIRGKKAQIAYKPIVLRHSEYYFGGETVRNIHLALAGIEMVPELQTGDWVAFHWDVAAKILTNDERRNLEKVTLHNLQILNANVIA